ncbi:hypothetical protein GCM10023215_05750 [Pseudonocardia yuanmonensis]|uniref:Helix-hairpin-helix DNA-binding motif class 1 domain-containing protein n=1 Tax=Pseudonocardia yuanmonensis TaxID=1095914 RepID=A0ABP8VZS1_9PSEU
MGRPYPTGGRAHEARSAQAPAPGTRPPRHAPLPLVLRPALPPGRTAFDDPPTLPLPVAGPAPAARPHAADSTPGDPHFAALLAGSDEPFRDDDAAPADEWPDEEPPARAPGTRPGRLTRVASRWVPAAWRGARLDPGRAGAVALVLVAAVAAVVAAVGVWSARPRAEHVPPLPTVSLHSATGSSSTTTATAAPTATPTELVVSVSGKVRRPGLVRVPDGARVADVLEAAGGALPGTDLTSLNLARRVADGEQVAVGVPAAADAAGAAAGAAPPGASPTGGSPTGGSPTGGGGAAPAGKIDLNRATVEQLDGLPGVGPVTAQRILDWRTRNGRFARVDQLREVEGIGERRFSQLRELVTV